MRSTRLSRYKLPKNLGVAPRFDTWQDKYEPHEHLKRMGRLAGTGFYIPPEWYQHFRMFPPINHNFPQEKTLNPHNSSEPTQDSTDHLSAERQALRDELARRSRLIASEGMRYYNIFWVRKPLDRMEKEYYRMKRKGIPHEDSIKAVLEMFYADLANKKRVAAIQAEEAKLSGKFITMREATVVLQVLTQLQREQLTPHQASQLAQTYGAASQAAPAYVAHLTPKVATAPTTPEGGSDLLSSEALADLLSESDGTATAAGQVMEVHVKESEDDSLQQLREVATDATGDATWYTGSSSEIDLRGDAKSK